MDMIRREELRRFVSSLVEIVPEEDGSVPTTPSDRTVRYKDDWSDDKVAQHFGCTRSNVYGTRSALIGKLVTAVGGARSKVERYEERIVALERDVKRLMDKLSPLLD